MPVTTRQWGAFSISSPPFPTKNSKGNSCWPWNLNFSFNLCSLRFWPFVLCKKIHHDDHDVPDVAFAACNQQLRLNGNNFASLQLKERVLVPTVSTMTYSGLKNMEWDGQAVKLVRFWTSWIASSQINEIDWGGPCVQNWDNMSNRHVVFETPSFQCVHLR